MVSTYSPSLRLELMATGDQSGTWGTTTNTNLGTLLEQAIAGVLSVAQGDVANLTLSATDGASDEARNMVVDITGAITAARNVVVPTAEKVYLAKNSTTGGYAVTFKTTAGTGVSILPGTSQWVYCDGTNVVAGLVDLQTLSLTALSPTTTDGLALGTTSLMWADLFLASGGVINWNNGDVTVTHSANTLAFAGASLGYTVDVPVRPAVAGSSAAVVGGHLYGCTLSNNGADATNDIDIAAGEATDSTVANLMVLASALTKKLDAAWAVGTNQGGLDTGAIANTTYHVFLIKRSDTGVVDALFSASATAPTMPANYDYKRRIGSILRESAAIVAFVQNGDDFARIPVRNQDATNPGTSAVLVTLSVPIGIKVRASTSFWVYEAAPGAATSTLVTSPDQADTAAGVSTYTFHGSTVDSEQGSGLVQTYTDTSGRIRYRLNRSDADTIVRISTMGWTDTRGKAA